MYFTREDGELDVIPAAWTDVIPLDPFVLVSNGRSVLRISELLQLVKLVDDLTNRAVK